MKKFTIIGMLSITVLGIFSGCSTYYAYNRMIPDNVTVEPDGIATLVIAYPLKPNTVDGVEIEEIGGFDTVIEILPGEHELVFHMDTATSGFDRMYTSQQYDTIETSGIITQNIMTYPGQIHFYRIIKKDQDEFWTGITNGPNPFTALDGTRIFFDPLENTVIVNRNGEESEFALNSKLVYYSWDTKHLSFITYNNKKWLAVIDGIKGEPLDGLVTIGGAWSLDGSQFAYAGWFKQTMFKEDLFIIVNEKRIGPIQSIDPSAPFFFDIYGNLVCSIKKNDIWYLKRGNEEIAMESQYAAREKAQAEYDKSAALFQDNSQ